MHGEAHSGLKEVVSAPLGAASITPAERLKQTAGHLIKQLGAAGGRGRTSEGQTPAGRAPPPAA